MDSFGSGRLSDEERPDRPNGTLTRVTKVECLIMGEDCIRRCLEFGLLEKLLMGCICCPGFDVVFKCSHAHRGFVVYRGSSMLMKFSNC